MRKLIMNDLDKCVGCNRCIRVCPVEEANVAYVEGGATKVRVDNSKCIVCGSCISTCHHQSRSYVDDTDHFFEDLRQGVPISLFCAPASRANLPHWDQVLSLLRQMGVQHIYDVSLGADICTWAYIRYIQKYNPASVISQPCPAIVNYILMHHNELLPNLAPVHSPMLCTAIYMRKYQGITDKIAALSPCIAKANEFEETGNLVSYNITFVKLEEYINRRNLTLPLEGSGYDHIESALGSIYSMPGGLKENVEFMLGKALRIDKSEGQGVVYKALDAFAREKEANRPAVFDVLNCPEGCNLGTGCHHNRTVFEVNSSMDAARHNAVEGRNRQYFEELYQLYDNTLNLDDFIRHYTPRTVRSIAVSHSDIEQAFNELGKYDEVARTFDCSACGSDSCRDMAVKIAKGVNTAENCIQKAHEDVQQKHVSVVDWQVRNAGAFQAIQQDITNIKELSDQIVNNVSNVDEVLKVYDAMAQDIGKIAMHIHMISLNASIEAARAGQHGVSFAVIAQAIRSLASDTQEAITKITRASADAKGAIGSISNMVVTIGDAISQSHTNMGEIAASTQEVLQND